MRRSSGQFHLDTELRFRKSHLDRRRAGPKARVTGTEDLQCEKVGHMLKRVRIQSSEIVTVRHKRFAPFKFAVRPPLTYREQASIGHLKLGVIYRQPAHISSKSSLIAGERRRERGCPFI